jgi:hypothetical protein
MDATKLRILNDPKVYDAWKFFGTGKFEDWVDKIIAEYNKKKIDIYV